MVSGKYSALAGAVSREQAMANVANNLANISTAGYKKMTANFESLLRGERQTGTAKGINYNRIKAITTDFSQGPLKPTGNQYDLAIHGPGFFKVLGPDGPLYTRNGAFSVDQNGTLKTSEGYPVLSDGDTPIEIGGAGIARISINSSGIVSALDNQGNRQELGRIAVVDFDDPGILKRRGDTTFFLDGNAQETAVAEPQIVSGSLELANVNMIEEMAEMINSNRLYETYHKVLKGYSSISEKQEELGTLS